MIRPPEVPDGLRPNTGPLTDEVAWDEVLIDRMQIEAGVELRDVELTRSRIVDVGWAGVSFTALRMEDVVLERAELAGATLATARLRRVRFEGCRLTGLVAAETDAEDVVFDGCVLDGAWLRASTFNRTALRDCGMREVDLYGARFRASEIVRCALERAELSATTFEATALHGSTFDGASGLASVRGVVIDSSQIVHLALPILEALDVTVDDGHFDEP